MKAKMRIKQRNRRKKPLIIGAIVAVMVLGLGVGTGNALRPLPAVSVSEQHLAAPHVALAPLAWPGSGQAAVEAQNVGPLLTSGEQKALPTASIAKIVACLTVLQTKPLNLGDQGPSMTLTQADLDIYHSYVAKDGSVIRVAPGEQLTEYQAMQAMLLPSANNVADSFAIWAFGSLAAYRTAATQYVQQLGLTGTTIGSDASGLSPDTTSTAADLVRLGEQAMASPVIAQIVTQTSATLPVEGAVYNVNRLLGQDGIVGIKTGNSDEVGGNLLFAANMEVAPGKTVTVIGAIMGQKDLNSALAATPGLLDSAKANVYVTTPVHAGDIMATYRTIWGAQATAVAKKDLTLVGWKGAPITPKLSLQKNSVSYTKDATVGNIVASGGTASATSDVVLTSTIPQPSWWWRITRH